MFQLIINIVVNTIVNTNTYMGRFRIIQDFLAVNVTKIPDFAGLQLLAYLFK